MNRLGMIEQNEKVFNQKLFKLGLIGATLGVCNVLGFKDVKKLLDKHLSGDWGEVGHEDAKLNDKAVHEGTRILSVYTVKNQKIWIITEADRSITTLLLPEEY